MAIALPNRIVRETVRQDSIFSAALPYTYMSETTVLMTDKSNRLIFAENLITTKISVKTGVANNSSTEKYFKSVESNLKLLRAIALTFFLLLFIPLGIFYPLFLFFQKLLGSNYNNNNNYQSQFFEPADNATSVGNSLFTQTEPTPADRKHRSDGLRDLPATDRFNRSTLKSIEGENSKTNPREIFSNFNLEQQNQNTVTATVSKLQIAFSPQASQLRPRLSQIASSVYVRCDRDIADLMQQAVSILLTQQHWTHVSHSSDPLPLTKIHSEFEMISQLERNKCINQELNLLKGDRPYGSHRSSTYDDFYSYVIVTLILCTSKPAPLFDKIHTKAQLMAELTKLGKIERERLIKFELLWNPRQEEAYISNQELLTQYSDTIRLL